MKPENYYRIKPKKSYRVSLIGCDASTRFKVELSEEELALIKKLGTLSKETSKYPCMPKLEVEEYKTDTDEEDYLSENT
jgi:hypothetical protein